MTVVLVALLLAEILAPGAGVNEPSLTDLIADPRAFEGRPVNVAGRIVGLRKGTSRKGTATYTFNLSDGERSVVIRGFGVTSCVIGDHARVAGTVQVMKPSQRAAPAIDATDVTCR
jgi:hypothetical protein